VEHYDRERLAGATVDQALLSTVEWALRATWDGKLNRPWQSENPSKNREGLIRTLVWYVDQYGQSENLETIILPNGQPAIELNFEFDSGYQTADGEAVSFIGKIDKIVKLGDKFYVKDIKTTGHEVGGRFFAEFSPDNQFSLYSLAAKIVFDFAVEGLICDGIQVGATFSRFYRAPIGRPDTILDEWLRDSRHWLGQMESCAREGYWPQNDKGCGLYGGCEFRSVCGARPEAREGLLKMAFQTLPPGGGGEVA